MKLAIKQTTTKLSRELKAISQESLLFSYVNSFKAIDWSNNNQGRSQFLDELQTPLRLDYTGIHF